MKKRIIIGTSVFAVCAVILALFFVYRPRTVCGTVTLDNMTDATTITVQTGLHGNYDVYLSATSVQGYGLLLGDYTCEAKDINSDGTFQIRALIQSYDEHGETPVHYTGGTMVVNWIAIPK